MISVTSVLIVDDEPAVRDLMARWVTSLGLQVRTASNADDALDRLKERHADLAVIDVMMPGRNGLWLAGEVRRDHPHTAVVLATAYSELLDGAAATPVADLLIKPFQRDRFLQAVDRGGQWRQQALAEIERHASLSQQLAESVADICRDLTAARARGIHEADRLHSIVTARHPDLAEHNARVARHSIALAKRLKVPPAVLRAVDLTAQFHDIGKIAIPASLVIKPGPLTPGEVAIMRRHVDAGADILAATGSLASVAPLVRATHEWFAGGGYPSRLAGTAIPLPSRVIGVADAHDAMTHDRSYRQRLDTNEAIAELLRCSPSQFDPDVLVAFLEVLSGD